MTAQMSKQTDGMGLLLGFGFAFEDLYCREGLVRLDAAFLSQLEQHGPDLWARLVAARGAPASVATSEMSGLIVAAAPFLEDFIAELFGIERGAG